MQKVLKELADVVGLAPALNICQRWGGEALYVPVKVQRFDPLALVLGLETAQLLATTFGGQVLQLPTEVNSLLDLRNRSILHDHRSGMSNQQIGIRYGLSRQSVTYILRRMGAPGNNGFAAGEHQPASTAPARAAASAGAPQWA